MPVLTINYRKKRTGNITVVLTRRFWKYAAAEITITFARILPLLHPKPKINHSENCSNLPGESTVQAVLPTEEDQPPVLHPGEMVYPCNVHQQSSSKKIFHIGDA